MSIVHTKVFRSRAGEPGQLLHPIIMRGLPENANIADVGTGDASFLVALAAELSSVGRLDGFDTNPAPVARDRARGVIEVHVNDARDPFPRQFHGLYDVVCMHNMTAEFANSEWITVAHNLRALLKLNGALQLMEPDLRRTWGSVSETLRLPGSGGVAMYKMSVEHRFMKMLHGLENLQDVFESMGISYTQREIVFWDENRAFLVDCNTAMFEAWEEVREQGNDEIVRVLRAAAVREIVHGHRFSHDKYLLVGFGMIGSELLRTR